MASENAEWLVTLEKHYKKCQALNISLNTIWWIYFMTNLREDSNNSEYSFSFALQGEHAVQTERGH